jgi:hypothetical protein
MRLDRRTSFCRRPPLVEQVFAGEMGDRVGFQHAALKAGVDQSAPAAGRG